MNQTGRFAEARQYYFEQLFEEVIENFESVTSEKSALEQPVDVLFSVLGFTPEPIILAARALKPKRHIIFHDNGVRFNEDNMRYLSKFLPDGFDKIELQDESFATIYDVFKHRMALTAGRNYTINITGGKKSMVAAASIFARDFNASVIYVDYNDYDANLRRPTPGTEYLNVVYTPVRDLPELFHNGVNSYTGDSVVDEALKPSILRETTKTIETSIPYTDGKVGGVVSQDELEDLEIESVIPETNILEEACLEENILTIFKTKDWEALKKYLDHNLQGKNIRKVQAEVTTGIESLETSQNYWETVKVLLDYNAVVFIGAISNATITKIDNLSTAVTSEFLDSIIHKAFESPKKLKSAIKLLKPCSGLLSLEHKEFIMKICAILSSPESFYELFKLTKITPDSSVEYLLGIDTPASAFAIYRIFSDAKRNEMLRADSKFTALRPNVVVRYCNQMQESDSYAFQLAAMLIRSQILLTTKMDKWLLKEIEEYGFEGFYRLVTKQEQKIKSERNSASISKGDTLTNLVYVKSLDNYHLFLEKDSQAYVFLDKRLAIARPSKDTCIHATVVDIKTRFGKRAFFVAQKAVPNSYSLPPLLNIGDVLEIGFQQNSDGKWQPVKNNCSKLLSVEIVSMPKNRDYRNKQEAYVLECLSFFTYKVELI